MHQKNKHFKCGRCQKRLASSKALSVHCIQVHKEPIKEIPEAKKGREDPSRDIFGSSGIPAGMTRGSDPPPKEEQQKRPGPAMGYGVRPPPVRGPPYQGMPAYPPAGHQPYLPPRPPLGHHARPPYPGMPGVPGMPGMPPPGVGYRVGDVRPPAAVVPPKASYASGPVIHSAPVRSAPPSGSVQQSMGMDKNDGGGGGEQAAKKHKAGMEALN